jgi:ABC-type lipoprotein release transport system permease subunit
MTSGRVGFWVRIALLFLIRSGRSTAALSIMVVTAVAALIFLSALSVGVKDAMLRNTVGLFAGHITVYDLPEGISTDDLQTAGVRAVLKRRYLTGVLSGDGLALPLTLCGIDPSKESATTALEKKIVAGRYPRHGQAEILISRDQAESFGVHIGDALRFQDRRGNPALDLTVAGIFQTGLEALDRGLAFCALDRLPGGAIPWTAAVFLDPGVAPAAILAVYRQELPATVRFESWEDQMPDLRQLIDLEAISMVVVIVLVFGVVAIGIACSFVIFIIRNMREYGILKAMGVTTSEMTRLIMAKVALMNLAACGAGLLIGVLTVLVVARLGGIDISAFTSHNRYFAVSGVISPRLTAFSLWAPPAVSLVFSVLAGIWPALLVARKRAADILRMV